MLGLPQHSHISSSLQDVFIRHKDRDNSPTRDNIPPSCPGAYLFQRPFLRGLLNLGGLILGGKFASQNLLSYLTVGRTIYDSSFYPRKGNR